MEQESGGGSAPGASSALGAYHEGLDGMRAVSMTGVLLYHAGLGVEGSFLALSQFFTLSGFLITGMLVRAHDRGGVDLRAFWVRRVRRLVPAAVVALAAIVVFGATVATKDQVDVLPGQVGAALFWFFNWQVLASGESYVDLFSAPSPLDHFWSLSLEEQFYLAMSFGFVLLVRWSARSRVLIGTFGAIAAASAAWSVHLYRSGASLDRIYLATEARLTEILFGSILAVVVVRHLGDLSARARRGLAAAGAVAYAVSVTMWLTVPLALGPIWNGGMVGYAALTVLIILGILVGQGPLVRVLTWGPLPAYGRITYGVYLYHWPTFLWLDEDRTGLGGWPLFGLRMVVTLAAAIASNRLVERPAIEGRWRGLPAWARLGWGPVAFAAVLVGALAVSTRDAPDPAATFRVDDGSLSAPVVPDDGILDVLAVTDASGAELVARLAERGERTGELAVASVPFACSSTVVVDGAEVCREWAEAWPALVGEHNPDVVLLFVDVWAAADIARATGRPVEEAGQAAAELLDAGFDLLTSRGAPVVWARPGRSFTAEVLLAAEPFRVAMASLEQSRDDLRQVLANRLPDQAAVDAEEYLEVGSAALAADLSLYQRAAHDRLARVLVIGDSMARSLGFGLERWAVQEDRAVVWNAATPGCGLAPAPPGSGGACDDVLARLPERVADFDPDVVVALSTSWDVVARPLPGVEGDVGIDDERHRAFLREAYASVIDVASAGGATVVWLTAPCAEVGGTGTADAVTLDLLNHEVVVPAVEAAGGRAATFDLAGVLCPGGTPLQSVEGVDELRSDGIHFSVEGSIWFAEEHGPELLALGGI